MDIRLSAARGVVTAFISHHFRTRTSSSLSAFMEPPSAATVDEIRVEQTAVADRQLNAYPV
jgi:hypothetical protein